VQQLGVLELGHGILALMSSYSIYLHIPFCQQRCSYCDFNTYSGLENLVPKYIQALCLEIELVGLAAAERLPIHTIFFGGGTPSLLSITQIEKILAACNSVFKLSGETEITLEANPGTISLEYLKELFSLGINRISLGMQSANNEELKVLERQHNFEDTCRSVDWIRKAGFVNLNLDLIFGLPFQTLENWQVTLRRALDLQPDHFSLYALTLEHGTPLQNWVGKGIVPEPDQDLAAEMYEFSSKSLEDFGYTQYEISNWCRPGAEGRDQACRHNLQYWRGLPYLGFGAGAHGFAAGIRTANVLAPSAFIQRCFEGFQHPFPKSPATIEHRIIDKKTEMAERMMMGLRLTREGISTSEFKERFGLSLSDLYKDEIERLVKLSLLEWAGEENNILRLTTRGRLLGNRVFMEFI
jgi:oxygen-independent coproporphyrinogen III oxidase